MRYNFITIEGNIGTGKTTLASKIANDLNAKLILEQFEDNAFLPKFYEDPVKYAFPLELSFLAERYQQLKDQLSEQDLFKEFTISDYSIQKSLLFASITLADDEYQLFSKLFNIINLQLPKPDLFIYLYLDIEKTRSNIQARGRKYEMEIQESYLADVQKGYFQYMKQQSEQRILIIDVNDVDFVNNKAHYNTIVELLDNDYAPGINRASIIESNPKAKSNKEILI